jgi:hypothetical protein
VRASAGKDGFLVPETRVATLRRLLEQPGIYQAPACYDALSASLVEKAGFDFAFMSGRSSLHLHDLLCHWRYIVMVHLR